MSPGIRLTAHASSFISPRRPPGHAGLGSQACRKAKRPVFKGASDHSFSDTAQAGTPGAGVLGCEIKEEAAAAGGCRGTFAPKGTRTRSPYGLRTSSSAFLGKKNKALHPGGLSVSGSGNYSGSPPNFQVKFR